MLLRLYRFLWFVLVGLIVFLDRHNFYLVMLTLFLLILLSFVAILRTLESRNQWRKYLKEDGLE